MDGTPLPRRHHAGAGLLLSLACLTALACAAATAGAASLQVAPTRLELPPGQNSESLWLTNSGTAPLQVQIRVFDWTQSDGADVLVPTTDIEPSPPLQRIAAGQAQLIRLVRSPAAGKADNQRAYRVIVDEVPEFDPDAQGMQFVLRYSIPLFSTPQASGRRRHELSVRPRPLADGTPGIEVHNQGGHYAQLADLAIGEPTRPRIVRPGLVGYVLPGKTMHWPLETRSGVNEDTVFSAKINGDPAQTRLPAATPSR